MAASFHFVFELIKIALLTAIYASPIYLLVVILKIGKDNNKYLGYGNIYNIIYVLLFVFSFTYYGDHGLGDDSNIPLGHGQTMQCSDEFVYFVPDGKTTQMHLDSFLVKNDHLCAVADSIFFVCELKSSEIHKFPNEKSYNSFAATNNLPSSNEFKGFLTQYNDYWSGWRFWLLP